MSFDNAGPAYISSAANLRLQSDIVIVLELIGMIALDRTAAFFLDYYCAYIGTTTLCGNPFCPPLGDHYPIPQGKELPAEIQEMMTLEEYSTFIYNVMMVLLCVLLLKEWRQFFCSFVFSSAPS
jgi:hypothetical protein